MSYHLLGVSFALLSALLFGGGDFSGGFATRRALSVRRETATRHSGPFQVLAWSALSGALALGALAWWTGETLPSLASLLWAAGAGLSGALGLVALYRALAQGNAAVVSPIAGVIGAVLPVIVSAFTEGLPGALRLLGFAGALVGIGLVTRSSCHSEVVSRRQIVLAVLSGLGFGAFFLLAAQVEPGAVLAPLAVAKIAGGCVAWGIAFLGRRLPAVQGSGIAWVSGALDAAANALYLLAQQYTRLDVAVVLTSLYPAVTVLLAYLLLKERISRVQWVGVALCSGAIALIAL